MEFIDIALKEKTQVITFKRPEVFNAMNKAMKREIVKAVKEANKNQDVGAIVLTGEGKAFSSGQDLSDRSVQAQEGSVDLGHTLETEWNPLVNALTQSEKLVIGAINGVCAGAGLSVAMACDLIIAAPKVKFVSGFSAIGLAPDAGSSHLFAKSLGQRRALEFFLFNRPYFAEDLQELGMINQVCDNPLDSALTWAQKVNDLPPLCVKLIKKNLQYALDSSREQSMQRETAVQKFLGNSEDYKEGISAFLEKRKANFQGR